MKPKSYTIDIKSSRLSNLLTFDDIDDIYYTESIENQMRWNNLTGQSNEDNKNSERMYDSELDGIFTLLKTDYQPEEMDDQLKEEVIKHLEDDPDESMDVSDLQVKKANSEQPKLLNKSLGNYKPEESTGSIFKIDENHFKVRASDLSQEKANSNLVSPSKFQESKKNNDEVINEVFDTALDADLDGMIDRPERVSSIVQDLTPDDFEMIR